MAGWRVYFLLANLRPDAWVRRLERVRESCLGQARRNLPDRPDEARQAGRDTRCVTERQATHSPKGKNSPNRERHENRSARVMGNVVITCLSWLAAGIPI